MTLCIKDHMKSDSAIESAFPYTTPKADSMRCTAKAAIHATTHWKAIIPTAHPVPFSRLTEVIAAMQGV